MNLDDALLLARMALLEGLVDPLRYVEVVGELSKIATEQLRDTLTTRLNLSPRTVTSLEALGRRRLTIDRGPGQDTLPASAVHTHRYVLSDEIGRGGSARVILAEDRLIRRNVAMKVLISRHKETADRLERFLSEAQVTGRLSHPNIMPVYDIGVLGSGEPYFTMKYMGENNLRLVIQRLRRGDHDAVGEYGLIRLLAIFNQLCMAVDYAHDRGVVHRDLKPENILLGDHAEVILTDWGIAKQRGPTGRRPPDSLKTPTEAIIGTPEYMSPEQALGEKIGPATDIYALGCLLYEILTLSTPFEGARAVQILVQVVQDIPVAPSTRAQERGRTVPAELETICMAALRKDPRARPQSASALRDAVESWIEGRRDEERVRRLAVTRLAEAGRLAQRFYALSAEVESTFDQVGAAGQAIEGWESIEEKSILLGAKRILANLEVEAIRAFGEAEASYLQVLAYDHDNAEARRALADLHWARLEEAERNDDNLSVIYYSRQVALYDTGRLADKIIGNGALAITSIPTGASVILERLVEDKLRLVPSEREELGETPVEKTDVKMGAYLAHLTHPELGETTVNFRVGRCELIQMKVPLGVPVPGPDFVFIPPGPTHVGGDLAGLSPLTRQVAYLGGFHIARYPVTFAEYLEFISELDLSDPEEAIARMPRTREAGILCQKGSAGRYEPVKNLIEASARTRYQRGQGHEWFFPVFGVSFVDALAFIAWRTSRDARVYRLPTELEWERAARGGDGRLFPWGNHFDATFCRTAFSRNEPPQPEPVGVFEADTSPFGVRDLAGGVREWTSDTMSRAQKATGGMSEQVCRGGAWNLEERFSRAASRSFMYPETRDSSLGFRLAADITF